MRSMLNDRLFSVLSFSSEAEPKVVLLIRKEGSQQDDRLSSSLKYFYRFHDIIGYIGSLADNKKEGALVLILASILISTKP